MPEKLPSVTEALVDRMPVEVIELLDEGILRSAQSLNRQVSQGKYRWLHKSMAKKFHDVTSNETDIKSVEMLLGEGNDCSFIPEYFI